MVVKLFPVSHSAALFRQLLLEAPINEAFLNAPAGIKETFQFDMGIFYEINDKKMSSLFSIFYLIGSTLLFFALSLFVMGRKTR